MEFDENSKDALADLYGLNHFSFKKARTVLSLNGRLESSYEKSVTSQEADLATRSRRVWYV